MNTQFYTVDELTQILKLHPKTILRFIHEGKLQAQKVGRSWRISSDALRDYAHAELATADQEEKPVALDSIGDRMRVSAVIEITEQNSEEASRLSNTLMAALNCKDPAWGESRVDCFYYPEAQKSKFALYGKPAFICEILGMFSRLSSREGKES